MPRLFLVTPVRDEAANLPRLVAAVTAQTVAVDLWLLLENGSTDGTNDFLASLEAGGAVKALTITHEDTGADPSYALGSKYARLIARGMELVRAQIGIRDDDFFGILDADTFPEPTYYRTLLDAFATRPRLGITSGLTVDENGRLSPHRRDWARGSCRVWRGACLNEAGYLIGPSADSLSAIKAEAKGWEVRAVEGARAEARPVGGRVKFGYYGQSAYYRGETLLHCVLRSLRYGVKGYPSAGWSFFRGYVGDWGRGAPQVEDPEIRAWSRGAVWRLMRNRIFGRRIVGS